MTTTAKKETTNFLMWLEQRKHSIGGSDAAAIVGMNPYRSAFAVWADKVNPKVEVEEDTEAMRQGRELETYVAARFAEATGKRVMRTGMKYNPKYPFAHANIDRRIIGENAGLECKTTSSLNLKRYRNGEYPEEFYTQCVHYMAVCGFDRMYLAVLIFGKDFKIFTIERDEAEINALMAAERVFWDECVLTNTPPNAVDYKISLKDLDSFYNTSTPETTIDLTEVSKDVEALKVLKDDIKELEALADEHEAKIKAFMKDYEKGHTGFYSVSWKTTTSRTFDSKRYIADHAGQDLDSYYNERTSRRFTIKELKERA